EVAEAIEENREVVIAAVDRDGDRPLRVRIAAFGRSEFRKGDLLQREVALIDERLDLLNDLFRVARRWQNAAQLLELHLQAIDFGAELRKLPLRRATLFDLLIEIGDLRFVGLDLLV